MQRDMHTIRELIQRAANGDAPTAKELEDPRIKYHWWLAHDGGFLDNGALTADGLEFVELTKDTDVWDSCLAKMHQAGTGGGPWSVLKELLERAA